MDTQPSSARSEEMPAPPPEFPDLSNPMIRLRWRAFLRMLAEEEPGTLRKGRSALRGQRGTATQGRVG